VLSMRLITARSMDGDQWFPRRLTDTGHETIDCHAQIARRPLTVEPGATWPPVR